MEEDSEWMSISDMMSGLMLIFMFIAISFMIQVQDDKKNVEEHNEKLKILIEQSEEDKKKIELTNKELQKLITQAQKNKEKIQNIVNTYYKDKEELNQALNQEFKNDLLTWEAEITKDNIIVFHSPTVLFSAGKSSVKKGFKKILNDFFPRYIKILSSLNYKNEIDEIRIEGHTSNIWNDKTSRDMIYLKNMTLSQARANNVLSYCYSINNSIIDKNKTWLEKHFRANGMAFSKLKYLDIKNSRVDLIKSKRVEFRVQMKTEDKIYQILKVDK